MPTHIKEIEIKNFRSIHELEIKNIESQLIITGSNDVGKSNILKALNLFFNGEIEPGMPLVFKRDFNITERERIKEKKKVKQSISIKLTIEPPKSFASLKGKRVQIRKTWFRDGFKEEYFLSRKKVLENARSRMTISKLKNKMMFEYVPALRDINYFRYIFRRFQDCFLGAGSPEIKNAVGKLNTEIEQITNKFQNSFLELTKIPINIKLPQIISELFESFIVETDYNTFPKLIDVRGIGIQNIFIASLLNFISETEHSKGKMVIWGFEEPENSLEANKISALAETFRDKYTKNAQIFITTHSFSFINKNRHKADCILGIQKDDNANSVAMEQNDLVDIAKEVDDFTVELMQDIDKLRKITKNIDLNVLIVEGVDDREVLIHCWNLMHPDRKMKSGENIQRNLGFQFILQKGNTNDDAKVFSSEGSIMRYKIAEEAARNKKKALIMEDKDNSRNDGKLDKDRIKRRRTDKRNLNNYFLNLEHLAKAFGVTLEDMNNTLNDIGSSNLDKPIFNDINGKKIYDKLNEKYGRDYKYNNMIEAHHVAAQITSAEEIPDFIKDVIQCIEWLIENE